MEHEGDIDTSFDSCTWIDHQKCEKKKKRQEKLKIKRKIDTLQTGA